MRIAFLGCGFITQVHSRHLKRFSDEIACSYASRDRAKADAYCRRYRGEGTYGDYAAAKRMLESLAVIRPPLAAALKRLEDIPTDIEPLYTTADTLTHARKHPWVE